MGWQPFQRKQKGNRKKTTTMKISLKTYLPSGGINNELERAIVAHGKLLEPSNSDPQIDAVRREILALIVAYEKKHSDINLDVSVERILESDLAEVIVKKEEEFIKNRREVIKAGLKMFGLKQKDLSVLLDHKSVTYVSDLIRGRHPMSITDMLIISKVLKISMNELVPKTISHDVLKRLSASIKKLNNPGLSGEILELATA